MLFNSLAFAAFLAAAVLGYVICPARARRAYLLAVSLLFYCSWSVPFAGLLLGVTLIAWGFARRIGATPDAAARRRLVTAALALLLLPLATFKYLGAISGLLAGSLHAPLLTRFAAVEFVGAIGISYYTLKLVSYVVDVYWERLEPCRSPVTLAGFASFFPQILSGPIHRAIDMLPELERLPALTPTMAASGLRLMLFGFFKKLVVADHLAIPVDQVFADPAAHSDAAALLAAYLFALQLYADFSGVTDIAIGAGRLLGIRAPQNFDLPFFADTIQEFWRRWHITLSEWLRDYVFTPLHMALRNLGTTGLVLALTINMAAIGVWHGPSWNYLVFGLMHAAYMVGSTQVRNARKRLYRRRPWVAQAHRATGPAITFHMVVASFVLFRADTLSSAAAILQKSAAALGAAVLPFAAGASAGAGLQWSGADVGVGLGGFVVMELLHVLRHRGHVDRTLRATPAPLRWGAYAAVCFAILLWGEGAPRQFIYARF